MKITGKWSKMLEKSGEIFQSEKVGTMFLLIDTFSIDF